MKLAFKDDSFAFEFVRNLGFTYYGGADIGEMFATAERIREGDFESWFTEWDARARRTLVQADADIAGGHRQSARESYLRASTYFRMAEFYLHGDPDDPRILGSAKASAAAYAKAAHLAGPTWEPIEIPYEGTTLPGYFYKVDDAGTPRPTLIFHGGYDSSIEELYFFGAAAAVRRGYNCLTFDGPGQGLPMREQKIPFRHDWEKVVTPVVDYALGRPEVDGGKLALMGMSLGGYLAERAAAFEHRFAAAVFFGGVYDLSLFFRNGLPPAAMEAFEANQFARFDAIVAKAAAHSTSLRWAFDQGVWSFGATGPADYVEKARLMSIDGIAGQIRCPCLVLDSEGDQFFKGQPKLVFDALSAPKTYFRFTSEDGAENHCQSGELSLKDEIVFNWLDDVIGGVDGSEPPAPDRPPH